MTGPSPLTPGVHRATGSVRQVEQELGESGWQPVVVTPGRTTTDFYADLARALGLPPWFGANLDALWDCLRELSAPTALVLADWATYAAAEPVRWQRFLELFAERAEIEPPFAVLLSAAGATGGQS